MPDPKTAEVRDLLKHLAKYLATPPTLADGEASHLTLTSDGKLRVDDPSTQEKVDAVEAKLDHATYGLAALKALLDAVPTTPELEADALTRYNVLAAYVDEVESILKNVTYGLSALKTALDVAQADLDNPGQYKADVSALALEASLTAIKGVGWTTETLKAIKDAIATAQADLDNPGQYKADVTNLDVAVSSRLAAAAYTAERGTDNAALASVCTEARLARLDAEVSSRLATASYAAERGTDNAMLAVNGALEASLTAIKGVGWTVETLKAIYDLVAAGGGGATAQQVWEYVTRTLTNLSDTRAAKIDNLDALVSSRAIAAYMCSDDLLLSNDSVGSENTTTYTKRKESTVLGGSLRIAFDLKSGDAGVSALGKIYRNGATLGTERSTKSISYVTYTENLGAWASGDAAQIYLKTGVATYISYACNFRVYGVKAAFTAVL